jgi:hypothetical protein
MRLTTADEEWISDKAFEISLHRGWPMRLARLEALARFREMLSQPKAEVLAIWHALPVDSREIPRDS